MNGLEEFLKVMFNKTSIQAGNIINSKEQCRSRTTGVQECSITWSIMSQEGVSLMVGEVGEAPALPAAATPVTGGPCCC